MNEYYVYEWFNIDTGDVFYVGKGKKDRWKSLKSRSKAFKEYYNFHNCDVRKIKDNMREEDAYALEKETILRYKNISTVLCNIDDGGRALPILNGKDNPMYGVSPKERMSEDTYKEWKFKHIITTPEAFGYMWECPDLFELDGQWFLAVSPQGIACQNVYGCGYFALQGDWRTDCTLSEFHALDDGFDYYAPQSFAAADGRRIQFGWMGMPDADYTNPTVEYGWQHCLTLPRVLTQDGNGCLLQAPAAELNALRGEARQPADGETVETDPCFDLIASPAGDFVLTIANGLTLTYTEADRTCTLRFTDAAIAAGRTERKAVLDAPCRSLRVVGDASSLEIFLNDGAAVLSTRYYPAAGKVAVQLCGAGSTLYSLSI